MPTLRLFLLEFDVERLYIALPTQSVETRKDISKGDIFIFQEFSITGLQGISITK
jgi:hypothetical protein